MELYQQMILHGLEQGNIVLALSPEMERWMKDSTYQALCRIRDVVRDDSLSDEACFAQVEEIICALEQLGSDGGFRHDFG
ncbi:MAG: hypothetical protein IJ960_04945 [Oscillospiraceae bacterium]|nr:hypothetical protein [Oscillospiraceae bacterium]